MGPAGTASYLRSLRHIFQWKHPAVVVTEFSDMDIGEISYDDDLIQVYALTNPAVSWAAPVPPATAEAALQAARPASAGHAPCSHELDSTHTELAQSAEAHANSASTCDSGNGSSISHSSDSEESNDEGSAHASAVQALQHAQVVDNSSSESDATSDGNSRVRACSQRSAAACNTSAATFVICALDMLGQSKKRDRKRL